MNNQPGMIWEKDRWGDLVPVWTSEPSLEGIRQLCEELLGLLLEISFLAEGAFNKLYTVTPTHSDKAYIMRVSLPVHHHLKTESEAATLEWLRRETSIPVSRVVSTCSNPDNELDFEWMLLDHMPGIVLTDAWISMEWDGKETITKQIAACIAQMNASNFKGIGSLSVRNPRVAPNLPERQLEPGMIISMEMFWGNRIQQNAFRGPFRSSKDWLQALLNINIRNLKETLKNEAQADEKEDLEEAIALAEDLQTSLPHFFPQTSEDELETTSLFHDDLNMHNILVHEGKLSATLDW